MPRKAAKRARTVVERDWRSTLFVWRGELEIGASPDTGPQISWRGAWLGTDDDTMPTGTAVRARADTLGHARDAAPRLEAQRTDDEHRRLKLPTRDEEERPLQGQRQGEGRQDG